MERDFESEYRELKQNETPDLWNRIEAGLSKKKIAAVPLENENKSIDIERSAVKKQTPWKRWGLLAAACLCVVIIFPAVIINLTGSSKNNSSGSADTTSDSAAAFDAAPAEAAAEEEKAETVYTENTAAAAGTADAGGLAGETETAAMDVAEVSEEAETEEAGTEAAAPEISDGQILERVIVQILQVDETGEETVYLAVVLEADTDAVMESGMQIELICNDETQYDSAREQGEEEGLQKEETYEVSLQYKQDRFVVLTAAEKN